MNSAVMYIIQQPQAIAPKSELELLCVWCIGALQYKRWYTTVLTNISFLESVA